MAAFGLSGTATWYAYTDVVTGGNTDSTGFDMKRLSRTGLRFRAAGFISDTSILFQDGRRAKRKPRLSPGLAKPSEMRDSRAAHGHRPGSFRHGDDFGNADGLGDRRSCRGIGPEVRDDA